MFMVVAAFKPGRFPTRIFFTRSFTDPDGKTFGKGALRISTLDKFRRLTRGYLIPYGVGEPLITNRFSASREWFERELAHAVEDESTVL